LSSTDKNARITWSVGLFYSHLDENVDESVVDPSLNGLYLAAYGEPLCNATFACPGGTFIDQNPINSVVDTQFAGFGELGFKLTDTFKATVGLRVSHLKYLGSIAGPSEPFFGPAFVGQASSSENPVTPKAVLSWQPDR